MYNWESKHRVLILEALWEICRRNQLSHSLLISTTLILMHRYNCANPTKNLTNFEAVIIALMITFKIESYPLKVDDVIIELATFSRTLSQKQREILGITSNEPEKIVERKDDFVQIKKISHSK